MLEAKCWQCDDTCTVRDYDGELHLYECPHCSSDFYVVHPLATFPPPKEPSN